MKQIFLFLLIAAASAWSQPAITPAQLGFIADGAGSLRPVYGVAGSFVLGAPTTTSAQSAAFSGSLGLLKTDFALIAYDAQGKTLARIAAPAGPALFGFSEDGETALAYLTGSHEVIQYDSGRFIPRPMRIGAASVVSIALPNLAEAALIVQRDDGLWELRAQLSDGRVSAQRALNGANGPVLELASGELVSGDAQGIVLTKPDGSALHLVAHLPSSFTFQQMSSGWVQVDDLCSPARYAVRITAGHEGFFTLPEARQ